MKKCYILLSFLCIFLATSVLAQTQKQYFDGADTFAYSLRVMIDTESANTWQIGRPQKTVFDSAATTPNVIITDTANTYPPNNNSAFTIAFNSSYGYGWGIWATRWLQKLDLDRKTDGGIVEFSFDSGNTWQNIFGSPYVYNLYGFDTNSVDTLPDGRVAFTGTDTTWRDIWLCFDYSYSMLYDSVMLRYTLVSDTIDSARDGWMIDNISIHRTITHTATKTLKENDEIRVFPTVSSGIVHIEAPKIQQFHIVEQILVSDINGRVLKQFERCPVKFFIDIGDLPAGQYYIRVKTNRYAGTFPITLVH